MITRLRMYCGPFRSFNRNFSTNITTWSYPFVIDREQGRLQGIVDSFDADIRYAIAYGSGVFPQATLYDETTNPPKNDKLLDFIFVVKDTREFHAATVEQFPQHYSLWMRLCNKFYGGDGSYLQHITDNFGAKMYYNVYCNIEGYPIFKYGVISEDNALKDLYNWETHYLAGRLQKPVKIIIPSKVQMHDDYLADFNSAMHVNLMKAVLTSLAELYDPLKSNGGSIGLYHFYLCLVSLSYQGDVRVGFAESIMKNIKILQGLYQLKLPATRYSPSKFLDDSYMGSWYSKVIDALAEQKCVEPQDRKQPSRHLISRFGKKLATSISNKISFNVNFLDKIQKESENDLKKLVELTAVVTREQTMKGLLTAGPFKSFSYLARKIGARIL